MKQQMEILEIVSFTLAQFRLVVRVKGHNWVHFPIGY